MRDIQLTSRLLGCTVSTTDDGQRLVSEDGDGTVTDGTSRNTRLPVDILAWQEESLGRSASSEDDAIQLSRARTAR